MKTMLIAATAVGAVVAGLVLYLQGSDKSRNKVLDAAKGTFGQLSNGVGQLERPAHHAMG